VALDEFGATVLLAVPSVAHKFLSFASCKIVAFPCPCIVNCLRPRSVSSITCAHAAIAAESSATAGLTTVNASASSFSQDFQTQVQRILSLGFNMVKIPFSFNDLSGLQPLDFIINCTLPTTAQLKSSVTNPNVTSPPGRSIPALNASAATVISGTCNSYLPNDSVLDRLLYVVDFLATNNLYVVLSNNVTADNTVAVSPSM